MLSSEWILSFSTYGMRHTAFFFNYKRVIEFRM